MSKLAVIKTGGKQYLVQTGSKLRVEKLVAPDNKIDFKEALLVADVDGKEVVIGKPTVATSIKVEVVKQGRDKKINVVHYKAKVRYHKKYGHRQPYTELKVVSLS